MSRKDYVAIAAVVNSIGTAHNSTSLYKSTLVSRLAILFTNDSEKFDSSKFRAACYKEDKDNG